VNSNFLTQQATSKWWSDEMDRGYKDGRQGALDGYLRPSECPHVELQGGNPIQCPCPDSLASKPYRSGYFMGWDLAQIDL
jgi:hypothetical protein